jgi:putative transposase
VQRQCPECRAAFPARSGSLEDARAFCREFFSRYNNEHRHSGIGLLTPADVHHGRPAKVTAARTVTLARAYETGPERFVRRPPTPPAVLTAVWINPLASSEDQPQ